MAVTALRSGEACYSSILCSAGYIAVFIAGSGKAAVSPAITRNLLQIHIGSIYTVTVIIKLADKNDRLKAA